MHERTLIQAKMDTKGTVYALATPSKTASLSLDDLAISLEKIHNIHYGDGRTVKAMQVVDSMCVMPHATRDATCELHRVTFTTPGNRYEMLVVAKSGATKEQIVNAAEKQVGRSLTKFAAIDFVGTVWVIKPARARRMAVAA